MHHAQRELSMLPLKKSQNAQTVRAKNNLSISRVALWIVTTLVALALVFSQWRSGRPSSLHWLIQQRLTSFPHVLIWQTQPFAEGWLRRGLIFPSLDPNTKVVAALRSVVVRLDHLEPGRSAEIIATLPVYDVHADKQYSEFIERSHIDQNLTYTIALKDLRTGQHVVIEGQRYLNRFFAEVLFNVPDVFTWPRASNAFFASSQSIACRLQIQFGKVTMADFDLTLVPLPVPSSTLAVCTKPVYGQLDREKFRHLAEWREHQRLMGVEVVHWSARDMEFGSRVNTLNLKTGGRDTFSYVPALEPKAAGNFDEIALVPECFARHRQATTFMGQYDHDEYLALAPNMTWSHSKGHNELFALDEEYTSAYLQMAWIDFGRMGRIPAQRLLDADQTLTSGEAEAISGLQQSGEGYYYGYDKLWPLAKDIHRTADVLSSGGHHATRVREQGDTWQGKWVRMDDPRLLRHQETPSKLRIHHARRSQDFLDATRYQSFPVTPEIIAFWKELLKRLDLLSDWGA